LDQDDALLKFEVPEIIYGLGALAKIGQCAKRLGGERVLLVTDLGIIADDLATLTRTLDSAAQHFDVIVSSGGMSVGETDYLKQAVTSLGTLSSWRVAIRPGKPFGFGRIGDCSFLGLPGNPLSALVTFWLLIRPFLIATQGGNPRPLTIWPVIADFAIPRGESRTAYLPAWLDTTDPLQPRARLHTQQD
jgi:molybdopterin molybdotransferase